MGYKELALMSQNIKETNLQISGMTCAACAIRIEKGLGKLDGVETANVNLALERSNVKYDPEKIKVTDLEKKIRVIFEVSSQAKPTDIPRRQTGNRPQAR
jgi:Cu+-exporting ATPase